MSGFEDFVTVELPKRPFAEVDGAPGQVLARSSRPERPRELVWVDLPGVAAGLQIAAGASGVSGHRGVMVAADGTLAHADPAHADSYVGISTNAAVAGDPVTVATKDTVSEPTWTWTPGLPVFFIADGLLTQTPPTTVCVPPIGTAITPTTILLARINPVFIGA